MEFHSDPMASVTEGGVGLCERVEKSKRIELPRLSSRGKEGERGSHLQKGFSPFQLGDLGETGLQYSMINPIFDNICQN